MPTFITVVWRTGVLACLQEALSALKLRPTSLIMLSVADTTVLVSGASGYIGTHVVKTLLDRGYSVRGTVRSTANKDKIGYLQVRSSYRVRTWSCPGCAARGELNQSTSRTIPQLSANSRSSNFKRKGDVFRR